MTVDEVYKGIWDEEANHPDRQKKEPLPEGRGNLRRMRERPKGQAALPSLRKLEARKQRQNGVDGRKFWHQLESVKLMPLHVS